MPNREIHEQNRLAWNAATEAHHSHRGDQAAFYRSGGSTLYDEERALLGDLRGLEVVHLQCNAGQDTLSLLQEGAASVTGIDISDTAIRLAQELAGETGMAAQFIRSDIYDWLASTNQRFDLAFFSYGALIWLTDLHAWAQGVARILKPGGRLVGIEFHPVFNMFEDGWVLTYPALGGKAISFASSVEDYVADVGQTASGYEEGVAGFRNPYPAFEHTWGIADIVTPILDAGLRLTALREYPYVNGLTRYDMRPLPGGRFTLPEGMPEIPMMYGLTAEKPAV